MEESAILYAISADVEELSLMLSQLDVSFQVAIGVLSWITVILGLYLGFEVIKFILEVIHDGFN